MSIYLTIYLTIYLSNYQTIKLSNYQTIKLYQNLSNYQTKLSNYQTIYLSNCLPFCPRLTVLLSNLLTWRVVVVAPARGI